MTSDLVGYSIAFLVWALIIPSSIAQSITRDANKRLEFLEFREESRSRLQLSRTVSNLNLSLTSYRRENRSLKQIIISRKEESQVALERFRIDYEKIEFLDAKPLGRGATSVVLSAMVFGTHVAVKKMSARTVDDQEECGLKDLD